jgi:hypothetical protein
MILVSLLGLLEPGREDEGNRGTYRHQTEKQEWRQITIGICNVMS